MGNPEFREYFESYDSVKVKHSYGPQGHRGISVLVFETSAVGFLQSEHLSKRFEVQGKGREAWERRPVKFLPGGKRQLYGYMAEKADLEYFNQHSQGHLFSHSPSTCLDIQVYLFIFHVFSI